MAGTLLGSKWQALQLDPLQKQIVAEIVQYSFAKVSARVAHVVKAPKLKLKKKPVQTLDSSPSKPADSPNKSGLQTYTSREERKMIEAAKAREATQRIRQWRHNASQSRSPLKTYEQLLEEERDTQRQQDLEKQRRVRVEQQDRMQKLKALNERHKREQERLQQLKPMTPQKPLYVELEERFQNEVQLPALQQRKHELARKRDLSNSFTLENVMSHARWYNAVRQSSRTRFSPPQYKRHSYSSSLGAHLVELDKTQADHEERQRQEERRRVRDRQMQYASIVKSVHTPTVDRFKAKEIELRLEILKNPVVKRVRPANSEQTWKPRKYPKNPLVPEPKTPLQSKATDYLSECRERRKEAPPESGLEKPKAARKVAERIEQQALRLENSVVDNPTIPSSVKHLQNVNDLLLKSAKAKLSVLANMSSDN